MRRESYVGSTSRVAHQRDLLAGRQRPPGEGHLGSSSLNPYLAAAPLLRKEGAATKGISIVIPRYPHKIASKNSDLDLHLKQDSNTCLVW
jgi:hypothetical protein